MGWVMDDGVYELLVLNLSSALQNEVVRDGWPIYGVSVNLNEEVTHCLWKTH